MTVHHLNCATMTPPLAPAMVAHCLLVERSAGLLLVDTGFGSADINDKRRLPAAFRAAVRPALDLAETALAQVERLGFTAADVTDIALTHLDPDHASGLGDFPRARVHVHETELAAAQSPGLREKPRYLRSQWAHGPAWTTHKEEGEEWMGFQAVTALADDVLLVPLVGHTRGHSGVAVRRPDGHWLLHAGDAFFAGTQLDREPSCPPALTAFQRMMAIDNKARLANLARLRELALAHPDDVTVFCAHDKAQLDALT